MKALGKNQAGLLRYLVEAKFWYGSGYGCGWAWGGNALTERVLESLVARGLASKAIEPILAHGRTAMVWRPTEAGTALVEANKVKVQA